MAGVRIEFRKSFCRGPQQPNETQQPFLAQAEKYEGAAMSILAFIAIWILLDRLEKWLDKKEN